jgi:hypothetical protein
MDANKEKAINNLNDDIAKLRKAQGWIAALPDGLPGQIWSTGWDIKITLPYDLKELVKARRLLGSQWHFEHRFEQDDGSINFTYVGPDYLHLCIYLDKLVLGDTCRRVQVGERTIPIFKVVCGAREMSEAES